MLFPISKVEDIKWFRACIGCQDFVSTERIKKCNDCVRCPYAKCGSHDDKYVKSEAFQKNEA